MIACWRAAPSFRSTAQSCARVMVYRLLCWLNRTLPSALPHLHNEFEDKPQAEKLCQQSRIHLHGHVTVNLERSDGCHFKATGCVKCEREHDQGRDEVQPSPAP